MLQASYEEFDYLDWLDEIRNDVTKMLPTGIKVLAVVVKGPKPAKLLQIQTYSTLYGLDSIKHENCCAD